jgi:2-methylcitrate dehydratase PrpD
VIETRFDQLPKRAVAVASQAILDCVGVGLAGAHQAAGQIASKWARAAAGAAQASVWGQGYKTSVHDAALVNGTAAHALDFDDVTWGLIGHPSASLVPLVLGLGEFLRSSGKDILLAYAVGFEVMAKVGRTTQPKHSLEGGWHATSSIGTFGTTAAACKLLGLNSEQVGNALGIAYSMTSGNVSNFGTMSKPLHAGLAARNGAQAGQFGQLGFTALPHPFDGPRSFYEVYSRGLPIDMAPLFELGTLFELVERGVVIKPYPCGVAIHPAIDAALEVRKAEGVKADDIEHIDIGATRYTYDKLSYHVPNTGLEGKVSIEYAVAKALIDGRVMMDAFTDEAVQAPAAQQLLRRIEMQVDEQIEREWKMGSRPVRMKFKLRDGRVIERKVDISKGNPEVPLSTEELREKFTGCARLSLDGDSISAAVGLLENLENLDQISKLSELLAGAKTAALRA